MPLFPVRVIAPDQAGSAESFAGATRLYLPGAHIWRSMVVVLTGLIGTCASFALFAAINGWQAHVADIRFSSLARDHLQSINAGLKDTTNLLYSMRACFESLDHRASLTEYRAFSKSLREHTVGMLVIADGRVCGFEALLRWHHPTRGLVRPGDFIQCAEETGLIVPIGTWALRAALLQAAQWPVSLRVAVNLSAFQIARDDLINTIEAALLESGQAGQRLELEITESALQQNMAKTHEALRQLRTRGVRITLDNFGTGSASLSHLRSFPFDGLKINQPFIAAMTGSRQGGDIVRGILQLAASLNIVTTAEGVETQAQLDQLATDGCRRAQGMLFSPALGSAAVSNLSSRWFAMCRNVQDSIAPVVMGSV